MSNCVLMQYREFTKDAQHPAMRDNFAEHRYEGQDDIVKYLQTTGRLMLIAAGLHKDVYTGKYVPGESAARDDGVFCWDTELAHYVDTYNLVLPTEFVQHVLG